MRKAKNESKTPAFNAHFNVQERAYVYACPQSMYLQEFTVRCAMLGTCIV